MDFLKNTFSKAKSFVSNLVNKPNISTPTGNRYVPPPKLNTRAPNISTEKGPAFAPAPSMSEATQVKTPIVTSNRSTSGGNTFSDSDISQRMIEQKMTNNVSVTPQKTVKADSLSPDNTMSSLKQARKDLEERFVKGLQPSDTLTKLADLRLEIADTKEKYDKEYKALKENPEGKLSTQLNSQLRTVKEKQNEQLGFYALREAALTGTIDLEREQQDSILKNIKEISGLTQADMVGGLQTDPITGDIFTFFQDPETGELTQQTVGKTSIKPDYDIRTVGGRVVALDAEGNIVKDIGSSSSGTGSGSIGITFTPADRQALAVAGLSASRIQQLQSDINTFGFDSATAGLTQTQKNAITKTMGGSTRFITPEYITNVYFKDDLDGLKDQAIAAGYGSKGFLGFGKSITDSELNQFLNDKIISQVETYRNSGVDEDKILGNIFE